MTGLSYNYTGKNGEKMTFTSYAELTAQLEKFGGSYEKIYTTVEEPYEYKGKRERVKLR